MINFLTYHQPGHHRNPKNPFNTADMETTIGTEKEDTLNNGAML